MFKKPRFIIAEKTQTLTLEKSSLAICHEALNQDLTDFLLKIFKSVQRDKVQINEQWPSDIEFVDIKEKLQTTKFLDLPEYINQLLILTKNNYPISSSTLILEFLTDRTQTQAYVAKDLICIRTFSLSTIYKHNDKKAEFWNFLKHLKS